MIPDSCWHTNSKNAVSVALRYLLETMADHPAVFTSDFSDEAISWEASAPHRRSASCCDVVDLCAADAVATLSPCTREARRLSCDHEDAIDAKMHRADAIAATTSR